MATRTPLQTEDVSPWLSALGKDPRGVRLSPVEAGTVNTSYTAHLASGERLFLRLYEQQDLEGARREASLLAHLFARDVPTPCPLSAPSGEAVSEVFGKALVVFPFLEGSTTSQARVTTHHTRVVGHALGKLHLAVTGLEAREGRFGLAPLLERVAAFRTHGSCSVRELYPYFLRELPLAEGARISGLPGGLVHGDLFRDNVLFQGTHLTALLDFESAHRGAFVFDLAVTMLSWCYGSAFEWELARALFDGYTSVRKLDEIEWDGFFAEARFACLRFAVTRIADETHRVGKLYPRFLARLAALDSLGPSGLREKLQ